MSFNHLDATKKSIKVANQILSEIKGGNFQVGDKLPPEEDLAKLMNTSRTVVREALSALSIIGIIERKSGSGTYVRKTGNDARVASRTATLLQDSVDVKHALDARKLLEIPVGKAAIEDFDEKDEDKFKDILAQMEKATEERDHETYLENNESFHIYIAQATGNPLLVQIMEEMMEVTKQKLWREMIISYFLESEENLRKSLGEHREMFRCLKSGNQGKLEDLLNLHFEEVERALERDRISD